MNFVEPGYFAGLLSQLAMRSFKVVHVAVGCTTFSVATGCTYRTRTTPAGTPQTLSLPTDDPVYIKCQEGNAMAENAVKVFETQERVGGLCSIENPKGSRLWDHPSFEGMMDRVINSRGLWITETNYCAFGRSFRGSRWILSNFETIKGVSRPCVHQGKRRHRKILAGHSENCKKANPYPHGLVKLWAQATAQACKCSNA